MSEMNKTEVIVQNIIPPDEPQGHFSIKISKEATVEDLLKQVYKESNVPVKLNFSLRSNGHNILQERDSLSKHNNVDGSVLHWSREGNILFQSTF